MELQLHHCWHGLLLTGSWSVHRPSGNVQNVEVTLAERSREWHEYYIIYIYIICIYIYILRYRPALREHVSVYLCKNMLGSIVMSFHACFPDEYILVNNFPWKCAPLFDKSFFCYQEVWWCHVHSVYVYNYIYIYNIIWYIYIYVHIIFIFTCILCFFVIYLSSILPAGTLESPSMMFLWACCKKLWSCSVDLPELSCNDGSSGDGSCLCKCNAQLCCDSRWGMSGERCE